MAISSRKLRKPCLVSDLLLVATLLASTLQLVAQIPGEMVAAPADSSEKPVLFWQKKGVQIAAAPSLLGVATYATWGERKQIRQLRNRYIPSFRNHYDDYTQYVSGLSVFALNAAGVEGKHTMGRALVSYTFSMAIMGVLVNSIKYTARVPRPSGDERNSFPSGHTANSFMNAAFLNKEYGQYRHPMYGVMGYTLATATAVGRQLNNRHWISDVLAGAGIGILSTQLGYMIADRIYRDKGEHRPLRFDPFPQNKNPSFIDLRLGMAVPLGGDLRGPKDDIPARIGFNMGLEGAWFLSPNIGVGAEYAFTSFPMDDNSLHKQVPKPAISSDMYVQPMGVRYLHIGPFFSVPLTRNWFVTGKLAAGAAAAAKGNIMLKLRDDLVDVFNRQDIPFAKYKPHRAFSWSAGAGIQKRVARNVALKYYTTYFHSRHRFDVESLDTADEQGNISYQWERASKSRFNHLGMGMAVTAFLW